MNTATMRLDINSRKGTPTMQNNAKSFDFQTEAAVKKIYDAALAVHEEIGSGQLDQLYEACLCKELSLRNVSFIRLKPFPFFYKDQRIDDLGMMLHIIVDDLVLVEINSFDLMDDIALLTRMNMCGKKVSVVLSFSFDDPQEGFRRVDEGAAA
jgi:GxxExxY protein